MTQLALSRRRFVTIAAGSAALAISGFGVAHAAKTREGIVRWHGTALGAEAEMLLPRADAGAAVDACLAEVARLEQVFSLYRPDSALVRLNAEGVLDAPPAELVELLSRAQAIAALSDGAFDPTVQPLWDAYATHFRAGGADPAGPSEAVLAAARAKVDWRALEVAPGRIRFAKPGMAVTLNGIAQGYITDKVADLLRARGYDNVLVSLGETRALGAHPDGRPWQVAPGADEDMLPLIDGALATSAGAGTAFDAAGRHTHIFDAASGRSADLYRSVTVAAATATQADAVSTALALLPADKARAVVGASGVRRAWLRGHDGSVVTL